MYYLFFLVSSIILLTFIIVPNRSAQKTITSLILREAWLKSILISTVGVFISTEVFSAFDILSETNICLFWTGTFIILVGYCIWKRVPIRISPLINVLKNIPFSYKILLGFVGVIYILPLFYLAITASPNNIDSINYHLTRVISWLQFHNLYHYPTLHIQQLYHNILGEYWQLHLLSVSPSDSFINLIQFTAVISSTIIVGLIVRFLGYDTLTQILSSVLLISLPIGIFESTSTQIDYLACFYFLAFVYFGLLYSQKLQTSDAIFMALALVFGCFTKYTIFFFALPFCIWFGIKILLNQPVLKSGLILVMIVVFYGIVFTPFFSRNYQLFEHPIHPPSTHILNAENLATEKHGVKFTLGNTLKNLSLHLGFPNENYNKQVANLVQDIHSSLGIDVNDMQLSADKYQVRFVVTEDTVSNLYLFLLIIVSLISFFRVKPQINETLLLICMISGFILFCSFLKFQLWSTRTHIPSFALGCVIIAVTLSKISSKFLYKLTWIGLITSLPFILLNPNKPLVSIRGIVKYALAYPPNFLCIDKNQVATYERDLSGLYDFKNPLPCYKLQKQLGYWDRMKLVSKLDDMGYYNEDKLSIYNISKEQQYFRVTGNQTYKDFMDIYPHINKQDKSIAYMSRLGYFHYWAAYKTLTQKPIDFYYIGYEKAFQVLKNEQRPFVYSCILTNDMNWVKKNVPADSIESIIERPTICLIKLKKPSTNRYIKMY